MLVQVHEAVVQTAILEIADGLTGQALEEAVHNAKSKHDDDDGAYAYVETVEWSWSETSLQERNPVHHVECVNPPPAPTRIES